MVEFVSDSMFSQRFGDADAGNPFARQVMPAVPNEPRSEGGCRTRTLGRRTVSTGCLDQIKSL